MMPSVHVSQRIVLQRIKGEAGVRVGKSERYSLRQHWFFPSSPSLIVRVDGPNLLLLVVGRDAIHVMTVGDYEEGLIVA